MILMLWQVSVNAELIITPPSLGHFKEMLLGTNLE
jgi:hypothetical protein